MDVTFEFSFMSFVYHVENIEDFQVPTMYTRLLQGYQTMDSDLQKACASAANQLRLMVVAFSGFSFVMCE